MWTQFPPPSNFHWHGVSTKVRWFQYSDPRELQIDGECAKGQGDIKIPTPMELQIDGGRAQGQNDIKIPTSMELQTDFEMSMSVRWYQNSHPHGISNLC